MTSSPGQTPHSRAVHAPNILALAPTFQRESSPQTRTYHQTRKEEDRTFIGASRAASKAASRASMGMEGSQSVQHHGRGVKAEGQAGNLGLDASAGQGAETPGQHLLYPPFAALHLAPSTHRTIMTTTTEVVHTTYYNPILISDTSSGGAQRGAEIGAPEHIAGRASLSPLLSAAETTSDYLMLAAQNERKFPLEGRRTPPGISSFVVSLDGHEALFQDQRKESYAGQLNASGSISPMRPCSAETPPAKRSGPGWVQLPRADAGLDQESDGGAAIISQALGWTHGPQVSNGDVDLELPLMGPSSGHSRSAQQEHLVKDEKGKGRAVDAPSSGVARTGDAPSNNLGTLRPKAPLTPATSTEYDHAPTMARLSTHPTTPSRGDLAEHANASSEYAQGHAIRRSSGSPPRKRARAASNESIIDPDVSTATDEGAPAAAAPAGATRPPSVEREGALPSPALSPSMMATADRDQLPRLPGDDAMLAASQLRSSSDLVQRSDTATSALARKVGLPNLASSPELSAFASLPGLFQSFPTLPDEAQRYILFQLLRNASLPVLQHVDQLVSPALRHDFLLELPPELAPLILSYLDAKTLCTLSRVSKSWRQLVEVIEGEHVWKQRMQLDGLWRNDGSEERDMQRIARRRRLLDGNMSSTSESSPSKTFSVNEFLDVFRQNAAAQEQAEGSNVPEGSAGPGHVHALAHLQHPQSSLATPDTSQEHVVPLQPSLGLADASGSRITSWTAADGNDADEEMSDGKQGVKLEDGSEQEVDESLAGRQGVQKLRPHPLKCIYRRRYLSRRNWEKGEPMHMSFPGQGGSVVTCLQFDSTKIVSAVEADHCIQVHDINTGRLSRRLVGHEGGVWALQYHEHILVSGSTDRTVRVWDLRTGACAFVFLGHRSTVRCLQLVLPERDPVTGEKVPPRPLIVTGSRDSSLAVWALPHIEQTVEPRATQYLQMKANPFFLRSLSGHSDNVRALHAQADLVASGSYDTTVRVWRLSTGHCEWVLRGHRQKVYSVVLDVKRGQCCSGSLDNQVRMWDLNTGECLRVLEGHTSLVGLLGLSPKYFVSAAADGTLRVWDANSGECKRVLAGHSGPITCFQHDDTKALSGSEGTLKLWDMASGHSKELVRDLQAVWQVAFDERFAVAAVQHGVATWYEVFDYGSVDDDEDVEAAAIDARLLEEKLARDEAQRQADESGRLGARNVGSTIDAIIDARLRELEQQDPHAESEETRRLAKFLNVRKKQHNSRSERHTLSALSQLVQFGDAELLEALQREEELMADWDTADTTEGEPETRRAPGPSTSNAARADNAGSGAGAGAPALASIADAQGAFSGRAHWSRETAQARAAEMMAAARAVASTSASASTSRGKTLRRSRRTKDESGAQEPALALQAGAGPSASANASTSASAGVGAEPSGSRQTIKTEDVDEEVGDDDDDEEMET